MGNAQAANELAHCVKCEPDAVAAHAMRVYPGSLRFVRMDVSRPSGRAVVDVLECLARRDMPLTLTVYSARVGRKKVLRNAPFAVRHAMSFGSHNANAVLRLLAWFPTLDVTGIVGPETLLHAAVQFYMPHAVCFALMQRGASPLAKAADGRTVLDVAHIKYSDEDRLRVFAMYDWEPRSLRDWWLVSCARHAHESARVVTHGTRAPAVQCALQSRTRVTCSDSRGRLEGEYCALVASFL